MKNLLNEIKAMNKIAGTQMTKEQEIAIIRERLQQLNELEFGTQKAFDSYQKQHDMRGDTQVTVAGKKMSVTQAAKQSKDPAIKGSAVFGKDKGGEVFGKKSTDSDGVEFQGKMIPKEKYEKAKAEALDTIGDVLKKVQGSEKKMNNSREMNQMVDVLTGYVKKGKIDKKEMKDAWDEYNKKNWLGFSNGDHKPLANLIFRAIAEQ